MKNCSTEINKPILIIFARDPVPGQVKTRLIPQLGRTGACTLHSRLLQRTLDSVSQQDDFKVELWTDTDEPSPGLQSMVDEHSLPMRQQQGRDLGARMHHAIEDALARSERVVLIGSDCPDLKTGDLVQAFEQLEEKDIVVAPAHDGGYVLIGCRKNTVELFDNIPWGTNQVYSMTRKRLETLGWSWGELPAHHDIDTERDLELIPELL